MTGRWYSSRKKDVYHHLAKQHGYRSRSAYKLLQINRSHHLVNQGDVVVDLGSSPGGWMQASREIVGEDGFVLGVDIEKIESLNRGNVDSIVADVEDPATIPAVMSILPRKADVVLSDLAPDVSGIWALDHARQIGLAEAAFSLARQVLRQKGNFMVKVFDGELLKDYQREITGCFDHVKITKPKASRPQSAELYILAFRLKPRHMDPEADKATAN